MKKLITIAVMMAALVTVKSQTFCIESRAPDAWNLETLKFRNYLKVPDNILMIWCQVDNRWQPYGVSEPLFVTRILTYIKPKVTGGGYDHIKVWEHAWVAPGDVHVFRTEREKCSKFCTIAVEVIVYNAFGNLKEYANHSHY